MPERCPKCDRELPAGQEICPRCFANVEAIKLRSRVKTLEEANEAWRRICEETQKRIRAAEVEAQLIVSHAEASKGPRGGMRAFWRGCESAAKAVLRRLEAEPASGNKSESPQPNSEGREV